MNTELSCHVIDPSFHDIQTESRKYCPTFLPYTFYNLTNILYFFSNPKILFSEIRFLASLPPPSSNSIITFELGDITDMHSHSSMLDRSHLKWKQHLVISLYCCHEYFLRQRSFASSFRFHFVNIDESVASENVICWLFQSSIMIYCMINRRSYNCDILHISNVSKSWIMYRLIYLID